MCRVIPRGQGNGTCPIVPLEPRNVRETVKGLSAQVSCGAYRGPATHLGASELWLVNLSFIVTHARPEDLNQLRAWNLGVLSLARQDCSAAKGLRGGCVAKQRELHCDQQWLSLHLGGGQCQDLQLMR